jgi:metabolite-proton symporter
VDKWATRDEDTGVLSRQLPAIKSESNRTVGPAVAIEAGAGVTPMKRVAATCLVGTTIEYYDFVIYSTAAALVFPTVFFPHLNPAMATTASMATFAVAFLSRPLGAAVFGHLGDRLGRKQTLVATLLIMGVSTVAVGLVPSTASIGVAAPLTLIALRLLQGVAVGGEWAGSALLSAEYAPAAKRGRYGMFTLIGTDTGTVLALLTFLGVNYTIGEHSPAFIQWGWRLPFLLSAALIGIGLYVRLNVDETPVFAEEKALNLVPKTPLAEVLRLRRREIALAAGSFLGCFTFSFMVSSYLATYAHTQLGFSRNLVLFVNVLGVLAEIAFIALSATLCDRVGRRGMILVGWAACLPWSFVVLPLMDTGKPICYAVAILGMRAIGAIGYGPTAAFIPELFATRYRYSGTALAVNLAGVVGGAAPPLIAGTLQATYGSTAIGLMLATVAAVSLVCTYLLPETNRTTLRSTRGPTLNIGYRGARVPGRDQSKGAGHAAPLRDDPEDERSHGGDYDDAEIVRGYWRPAYSGDGVGWALEGRRREPTILELGAGDGTLTRTIAALAPDARILSTDISPNMGLRRKDNVALYASVAVVTSAAEKIPLGAQQADIVTAAQSFHFFPPEAVAEIRRVTAPGGRMVVIWHIADRTVSWVNRLWDIFGQRLSGANLAGMRTRLLEHFPYEQMTLFENPQDLTPEQMVDLSHTGDRWARGNPAQRAASDAAVRQVYEDYPDAANTPLPYHTAVWVFSDTALAESSSPRVLTPTRAWEAMRAYTFHGPNDTSVPFYSARRDLTQAPPFEDLFSRVTEFRNADMLDAAECNETQCVGPDCGQVIRQPATGRRREYCSTACRVRAHRHARGTGQSDPGA